MAFFKQSRITSLLLIVLLSSIAAVLIAPRVDLPDTAFQRNSSPLSIHAQSHQLQHTNANGSTPRMSFTLADASILALKDGFRVGAIEVPSFPPLILRC
jgi:hypothetical protein